MTSGFDAGALERRYQFLDDCPDTLLSLVITSPIGELRERCEGLRAWRDALLSGLEPPETPWPPTAVGEPARRAIAELGLARFCRDQPELTDELLRDVLASFTRADADLRREIARRLHELEHERERAAKLKSTRDHGDRLEPSAADVRARDRVAIERLVAAAANMADRELLAGWSERARAWAAIADVFGDLGAMLGRGWDLAQGVLRHVGWNDLVRLRALIARIPQLQDIVRSLGRLHETHGDASVAEQLLVPVRRLEEELRAVPTPVVPIELKGIERSGDLARMLPVEAVMLGHSKLRLLWHARRAERALENLAELFRVLMADNRQLAPVSSEVALCKQYLELESLRLGERLQVVWHTDNMPPDALIPPLVLQPLVENAVYHGIEPASQPGEIRINIYRSDGQLHLVISNPYQREGRHHGGNKMALGNIKSRLMLHFDVEASLKTQVRDAFYQVHITLPYRTSAP